MMTIPTIFVDAGGPGKALDGRTILVLGGKELQVLVRLTRTAKIAAFQTKKREWGKRVRFGVWNGREERTPWLRPCGHSHPMVVIDAATSVQ